MKSNNTVDPRRAFVLSYIKVARREYAPRDTFETFFPFVVTAANPVAGSEFNPYAIAERLRTSLGWSVGGDFVELFTDGLEKRKLITPFDRDKGRRWTEAAVRPLDEAGDAEIDHLKSAFLDFTTELSGLLLHNVSADDRLHNLADALASNRLFSTDALQEYAERGTLEPSFTAPDGAALSALDFEYICARFIQHAHKVDSRSFNALIALANIGVVTQLANFFHLRHDEIEKTGSPCVVLDGPFLIDYIGLNGEIRRSDAALIVDAARQRGCKIWAFRHSVEEAYDIVKAVVSNDPSQRFGPLAAALRSRSVTIEQLESFLDDAFGIIRRLETVDEIFDVKRRGIKWEEDDFRETDWQAVYAKLSGWSDPARGRDCDSVLGVMRLRALSTTRNPWESKYFLLTSNSALARLALSACQDQDLLNIGDIGPAISRHEFAAILWLAGTPERRPAFITAHLLAAAQGMVARDRKLIEKVQEYSANLTSGRKEIVEAIIQKELSYEMLRDVTLGNPDRLSDASFDKVIEELVDQGRAAGAEEARDEVKEAHKRLRTEAAAARAEKDQAEAAMDAAKRQAEEEQSFRLAAEERARSAEAMHSEAAKKLESLELQAKINLEAATRARDAINGILDGAEFDWSKISQRCDLIAGTGTLALLAILAGGLAYLGWEIRQLTGMLAVGALVLIIAIFTVINDNIKSARSKIHLALRESLTRKATTLPIQRLEKRLKVPSHFLITEIIEKRVTISNRDAIIRLLEKNSEF